RLYGLGDRGVVAPGMVGDLNVIDFDRLRLGTPRVVNDLPAGGSRIVQGAEGYEATIKSGVVTFEDGVETGARPGRLVRGARSARPGRPRRPTRSPAARAGGPARERCPRLRPRPASRPARDPAGGRVHHPPGDAVHRCGAGLR